METLLELEISFMSCPEQLVDKFADYFWTKISRGQI